MKAGEYADIAEDKLPVIERRIWWMKTQAKIALSLLIAGFVLIGISGLLPSVGVQIGLPDSILQDFSLFLFMTLSMGVGALGGTWRTVKLEKLRLLCELVVACSEEQASQEKERKVA